MMMKKKVFCALLAVGTTFLSTGVVSAQSTTGLSGVGLLGEFKKKSLIGTWEETFTFIDGPQKGRVSVALVSYHDDGTLGGSEPGDVAFDPPPQKQGEPQTGLVTSDGVGSWVQTEWNTYIYTSHSYFSDLNGNMVGRLDVTGVYHLVLPAGDRYEGYSHYDGAIGDMTLSGYVTNVGVRRPVDLLHVPPPPKQP
jgi:hypothetical protein